MRTQSLRLASDLGHADVGFVEGQPAVDLVAENDDLVTPARLAETPRDGAVTQVGAALRYSRKQQRQGGFTVQTSDVDGHTTACTIQHCNKYKDTHIRIRGYTHTNIRIRYANTMVQKCLFFNKMVNLLKVDAYICEQTLRMGAVDFSRVLLRINSCYLGSCQ